MKKSRFGFIRVAAISPVVNLGNTRKTAKTIIQSVNSLSKEGVQVAVFPELCLAGGYTNSDLFQQIALQKSALDELENVCKATSRQKMVVIVGLPLAIGGTLYNVAVVVQKGKILGIVPKRSIPTNSEFYEARHFGSAYDLTVKEIRLFGKMVPVGMDLLFESAQEKSAVIAVEICEDVWTTIPPSSFTSVAGATIIANLSASNELTGKARYRRQLISQQSARSICGYIYCSAGAGESTTDVVFGGHCLIAENGNLLSESKRFERGQVIIADLDTEMCARERIKVTSFGKCSMELQGKTFRRISVDLPLKIPQTLLRPNPQSHFVPKDESEREGVCSEILNIQSHGLEQRMRRTGIKKLVLGLSGGLDSTLAFLVCLRACKLLKLDQKNIIAVTMPGPGTSKGTKSNAIRLAELTGTTIRTVPISKDVASHLKAIWHDGVTEDVTFENAQARERTQILMDIANMEGGLVIGTGDLSELALGWCTYNGDQMSHYGVNAGVPKTLVKYVVKWIAEHESTPQVAETLLSILATPVSPELKKPKDGKITQVTEDVIGPYELHDFFLYHFVRQGSVPSKIFYLASLAFKEKYSKKEIRKWLVVFIKRFFANQFKRSSMPDGPKVGSVALSPRGDWRMPSDASPDLWIRELLGK